MLNSLRLGNAERLKTKETLYAFIEGLSEYGNKTGIPMVSCDLKFDSGYNENPLINIITIGIAEKDGGSIYCTLLTIKKILQNFHSRLFLSMVYQ